MKVPTSRDVQGSGDFILGLIEDVRLAWRLLRDPRVPLWPKLIPVLALAYVFSPLDFLPDLFVGLGQLDDLAIVFISLKLLLALSPKRIVAQHLHDIRGEAEEGPESEEVITAEYRVLRDNE